MSNHDQDAANAAIDAAISRRANAASFGEELLAEGVPIVVLDEDGTLVERQPDGRDCRSKAPAVLADAVRYSLMFDEHPEPDPTPPAPAPRTHRCTNVAIRAADLSA